MNSNNENVNLIFMEFEEELSKAVKHYEGELSAVRAGRANPHILDKIWLIIMAHQHQFSTWQTCLFQRLDKL